MFRTLILGVVVSVLVPATYGAPYWIHWDGSQGYPEDNGWERVHSDVPAQRWFENDTFFVDSRQEHGIYDASRISFPGMGVLDPGETFVMRWRLKVDQTADLGGDPGVVFGADYQHEVGFTLAEDRIWSDLEPNKWASIGAHQFHEYEMRSTDMRAYSLYIDGTLGLVGAFFEYGSAREMDWGDVTTSTSLSEWEWVEFGIVPEPGAVASIIAGLLVMRRR